MKTQKGLDNRINVIRRNAEDDHSLPSVRFSLTAASTQKELRLRVSWDITYRVDNIQYPRQLGANHATGPWSRAYVLGCEIRYITRCHHTECFILRANARTKNGAAERKQADHEFALRVKNEFVSAYRHASSKRIVTAIRGEVVRLQQDITALIPEMRRINSEYLAERRAAKTAQREADTEALESGEFWRVSNEGLKDYFNPPFSRNYLADVSERWRAALYMEMDSTAYKGYDGNWRHKLIGTGRGYLCGIDDNGDEWGYYVHHVGTRDSYGDYSIKATIEQAMSNLFGVWPDEHCQRQGDLLFRAEPIPEHVELRGCEKWTIRESHEAWSPGLHHNSNYMRSNREIAITHTTHPMLVLEPGDYRVYASRAADDQD